MRLSLTSAILLLASTSAFTPTPLHAQQRQAALFSTEAPVEAMADSGKPPAHSEGDAHVKEDVEIPTVLPSDAGMDYVPLATMLATGQLAEADQVSFNYLCFGCFVRWMKNMGWIVDFVQLEFMKSSGIFIICANSHALTLSDCHPSSLPVTHSLS
jgi:hypothetical protein